MSTNAPLSSFRGSSPALDRRGWNLALAFQEVFTAVVRLRYKRPVSYTHLTLPTILLV